MPLSNDSFLRRALLIDAAGSGATGLLLVAASAPLAPLFGLPQPLLLVAGLIMVPFVANLIRLARQVSPARGAIKAVIAMNIGWVVASAALLFSGLVAPTLVGTAFVIAQALAVLVFAELQIVGLRRQRAAVRAA
jgi:hypothetical protein